MGVRGAMWSGILILIFFAICIDVCTEARNTTVDLSLGAAPSCSKPCINGKCSGLERCSCKTGYIPRGRYECIPLCKGGCPREAKCVAPGTCDCGSHYTLESKKCRPVCLSTNRSCPIEQGPCVCQPGWRQVYSSGLCLACVPRCERPCGNGTCIARNVCSCLPGYVPYFQMNSFDPSVGPFCVPRCENCEGSCVAPYNCVTETPYEAKDVSANGDDCDCFENCSESQRKCEGTTAKRNSSNGYWWIYLVVAVLILVTAGTALLYVRKRREASSYKINDTKTVSNPADCVVMSQINGARSS